jgi:prefoldin subunit 5
MTTAGPSYPTVNVLTGKVNPRGIPQVEFIEDVATFLQNGTSIESLLQSLHTIHSKYKMMETSLSENKTRYLAQIPDLQSSFDAIVLLESKTSSFETNFILSDQVHVKAQVEPENKVFLWLGANIMAEYTYEDAKKLLSSNIEAANLKLIENAEDMAYLKDQMITTEVNIARVYNYDVKLRRQGGGSAGSTSS